jgi:hypothetical protein
MIFFFYITGESSEHLQLRSYLSSSIAIPLSNLRFLVAVSAGLGVSLNLRKSLLSSSDKKEESLSSFSC